MWDPAGVNYFVQQVLENLERWQISKGIFFPTSMEWKKPPNRLSWRKRLYTTWLEYSANNSFHLFAEKLHCFRMYPLKAILGHFAFKADNMESLEGYFQSGTALQKKIHSCC